LTKCWKEDRDAALAATQGKNQKTPQIRGPAQESVWKRTGQGIKKKILNARGQVEVRKKGRILTLHTDGLKRAETRSMSERGFTKSKKRKKNAKTWTRTKKRLRKKTKNKSRGRIKLILGGTRHVWGSNLPQDGTLKIPDEERERPPNKVAGVSEKGERNKKNQRKEQGLLLRGRMGSQASPLMNNAEKFGGALDCRKSNRCLKISGVQHQNGHGGYERKKTFGGRRRGKKVIAWVWTTGAGKAVQEKKGSQLIAEK